MLIDKCRFLELDTDRDLFGGLRDDKFKQLLQVCFDEADSFSLSKVSTPTYSCSIEDMLASYLKQTIQTEKWFAYNGAAPLIEMIYTAEPETQDIIANCYRDIFLQKKGKVPKKKYEQIGQTFLYPSVLEDICFFKDKQMIFGTLSHEYICVARSISQDFEEKLLSLAPWRKTDKDISGLDLAHIYFIKDG